ncbi:NAD(P)/FAD-dependent oxidoreductase [Estrella lausannensis]|uniref:Conserved putative secreted protein n=1 Tax=Estrella lausannensis TaxID=483423 RepID=A0A0H5DPA7_9BACT|nr:NAD(P)/FAD-dependent oxidoreductase [Estrella lausannensis]CRX38232.1 Conserved putative secreted protein [Estrella lausannensis]
MSLSAAVIGGGAAGFFAALNLKEHFPHVRVKIFEKSLKPLAKVEISGGGRCNVTHNLFDPKRLVAFYPRGSKELLGPFHTFQPRDMWKWLNDRGVTLKAEEDGRVFPVTDSSKTIIDCFLNEAKRLGVELGLKEKVSQVIRDEQGFRILKGDEEEVFQAVLLASGSGKEGAQFASELGHTIVEPVPSLFGFNIDPFPLSDLSGVSVKGAIVSFPHTSFVSEGSLLITHFGFSGPAALKLSAFAARHLSAKQYQETFLVNWLGKKCEEIEELYHSYKTKYPKKGIDNLKPETIAHSLFVNILQRAGILIHKPAGQLSNAEIRKLAEYLTKDAFRMQGKTTNKQEFVTAGGVKLSEVDFKTMQSKKTKGLFFSGEALDIDGVTGGFNFQAAWTTGWIAAHGMGAYLTSTLTP